MQVKNPPLTTSSPRERMDTTSKPRIPYEVDRQLLHFLRQQLATQDVPEKLKGEALASFWSTLPDQSRSPR